MRTLKRTLLLIAGFAGGLLVLVIVLLLLAPWLINTRAIEQTVRRTIAERTGKNVTYQDLSIAFLPRPHLAITALHLRVPGTLSADIASLQVYPAILPLITGNIQLAKVTMVRPDATVELPASTAGQRSRERPRTEDSEAAVLKAALADLRTYAPDLLWEFNAGTLALQEQGDRSWKMQKTDGRFQLFPNGLDLSIAGTVDRWGRISAQGRIEIEGTGEILFSNWDIAAGRSSIGRLSARFTQKRNWQADLHAERATLQLGELFPRATSIEALRSALSSIDSLLGTITVRTFAYRGPVSRPSQGALDLQGAVQDLALRSPVLPDTLRVTHGSFAASTKRFTLTHVEGASLDATFTAGVSGTLAALAIRSVDVSLDGTMGPKTMGWFVSTFHLTPQQAIRTPLSLSQTRMQWARGGRTSLAGTVKIENGPTVKAAVRWDTHTWAIERLVVDDDDSHATLSIERAKDIVDLTFAGTLSGSTLDRFFDRSAYKHGAVAGDLEVHVVLDRPERSHARGTLQADTILFASLLPVPVDVRKAVLRADGDQVTLDSSDLVVEEQQFSLSGMVAAADDAFHFDAELSAPSIDAARVRSVLVPSGKEQDGERINGTRQERPKASFPITGTLRLQVGAVTYGTYTVQPLKATIDLTRQGFTATISQAALCGIGLTGSLSGSATDLTMKLRAAATAIALEPALTCMLGVDNRISGTVDLSADLAAQGPPGTLSDALSGPMVISARDGEILKATLITRVLALLNVTDIMSGEYAGKDKGGIRYRFITVKAALQQKSLRIDELVMDSEVMDLTGHGSINISDGTEDLTLLVAPIKTANWLVQKIPVVRDILDGTLITIAFKVTGKIDDPRVVILPPSAVGEGLVGITKRTLQLPFKIIEPAVRGEKKQDR